MDKGIIIRIGIIVVLMVVLIIMCVSYFSISETPSIVGKEELGEISFENINSENAASIISSAEITSALTENLELHATYYLEECYVQENEMLEAGENILKYTNGEYLVAPYKCVITSINIPEVGDQCTNENYVEISSVNALSVNLSIDESNVDNVSIGDEASINVTALENETLTGNVTKINSIGSGGNFDVTVEFENDGNVMLGMSSKVTL